jgi:hypothetical protein
MRIFNYLEFITEEAGIKGLLKLSREVKHKLEKIIHQFNDPIANAILDLDRTQQDITYINLTDKTDKVSYLDVSRAKYFFEQWKGGPSGNLEKVNVDDFIRIYNLQPEDPSVLSNTYFSHKISFTEISIGRLAKKLLLDTFKDHEISTFVERWVSTSSSGRFEIWERDKVYKAYTSSNYEEYSGSSLDHSCMNDDSSVNFYRVCPDVKILTLLDEDDDSIKARCLLWVDVEGRKIMDRVYYNTASDYYQFVKWGNENGYYIRNTKAGKLSTFSFNGKEIKLETKVRFPRVEDYRDENYPFVDTFCYYKDGFGMNYQPSEPGTYYKLQETDGTIEEFYNIDPKQRDMSDNENW